MKTIKVSEATKLQLNWLVARIIRYALELGLLWIDGAGRDKVCEALDAIDALEAQLEASGFTAADMATAEARGFRDGAASAMVGEPMAWMTFTEEGDPGMVFLDRLEACQYCEDDDPPKPLYLAAPPTAQAEEWTKPEPLIARSLGEWYEDDGPVVWWAWNGHGWAGESPWCGTPLASDWPGYHTHWTPAPPLPTSAEGVEHG